MHDEKEGFGIEWLVMTQFLSCGSLNEY